MFPLMRLLQVRILKVLLSVIKKDFRFGIQVTELDKLIPSFQAKPFSGV